MFPWACHALTSSVAAAGRGDGPFLIDDTAVDLGRPGRPRRDRRIN
ncbi:hypothetical protein ACIQWR_26515 [Streptomyces sp. NPDC098789]